LRGKAEERIKKLEEFANFVIELLKTSETVEERCIIGDISRIWKI